MLRIWKLAVMAMVCCTLLAGCGSTPSEESKAPVEKQQEQVEMAVPKKGIPVLMYHMIGDVPDNDAVLLESHFKEQMEFLKRNGFHPITLQQLHDYMTQGKEVPVKPVVLTFDDGYPDTHSIVMPIMKQYGFAYTVFIPTHDADEGTRLTWQQIKELKEAGADIQSHGYKHERMVDMVGTALENEVALSQEALHKQLGIDADFFCYPYGSENAAVEAVMKKYKVKLAFTMNPGWAKYGDNPYAVKRIWIGNAVDIGNFEQRITTEAYEQR